MLLYQLAKLFLFVCNMEMVYYTHSPQDIVYWFYLCGKSHRVKFNDVRCKIWMWWCIFLFIACSFICIWLFGYDAKMLGIVIITTMLLLRYWRRHSTSPTPQKQQTVYRRVCHNGCLYWYLLFFGDYNWAYLCKYAFKYFYYWKHSIQ